MRALVALGLSFVRVSIVVTFLAKAQVDAWF